MRHFLDKYIRLFLKYEAEERAYFFLRYSSIRQSDGFFHMEFALHTQYVLLKRQTCCLSQRRKSARNVKRKIYFITAIAISRLCIYVNLKLIGTYCIKQIRKRPENGAESLNRSPLWNCAPFISQVPHAGEMSSYRLAFFRLACELLELEDLYYSDIHVRK